MLWIRLTMFVLLVSLALAHYNSRLPIIPKMLLDNPYSGRNFSWGTNPHLRDVFLGSCYTLLGSLPPSSDNVVNDLWDFGQQDEKMQNCSILWKLFESSFRFKDDAEVTPDAYHSFFSDPMVIQSLTPPPNEALFWSGVSDIIPTYQYGSKKFVMETSGIISIMGDLMWCGSSSSELGFNMSTCVYGILNETSSVWMGSWVAYWAAASMAYSPLAKGNITILLRGSADSPAYRRSSFFGSCELPNMRASAISGVQIVVAPEALNQPPYEICGVGSLALLLQDLESLGVSRSLIKCTDNLPLVQMILCLQTPTAANCTLT